MKKYFLILIGLLCVTVSWVFAEQESEEYGMGEPIILYTTTPTDFIFDINNYTNIYTRIKAVSASRVSEGYCLDMMPISLGDIPTQKKQASGTLLVTSDVYLQNSYFYHLDAAGIAEWNRTNGSNWTKDERPQKYILSNNDKVSLQDYRSTPANNYSYYTAIQPGSVTYKREYHDGVHGGNIVASKPLNWDYMRIDATSPTGYQNQNYEVITYHVNKPQINSGSYVRNTQTEDQSVGGEAINITPRLLGCYAVQPYADGIDFGGPVMNFHHVEFLWLVQYNYKTAYPVMKLTSSTATLRQKSLFDTNAYYVSHSWMTTIKP